MDAKEYLAALDRLGLGHATSACARALGVNKRSSQRFAQGDVPVNRTIELLLKMYLAHGLPAFLLEQDTAEPATLRKTVRKVPKALQTRLPR